MDDFYDDFDDFRDESLDYWGGMDGDADFDDGEDFGDLDDDTDDDEDDFDDEAELLPILFSSGNINHYREFLFEITPDPAIRFWRNPEYILDEALHSAYRSESTHSVAIRRILHQEGADVLYSTGFAGYHTTIGQAVNIGHLHMICDFGLMSYAAAKFHGVSPLLTATANDDLDTVKVLLSMPGVDVNAVDHKGRNAVHLASDLDVMKYLVQHPGVDVNQLDQQQRSPLIGFLSSGDASKA